MKSEYYILTNDPIDNKLIHLARIPKTKEDLPKFNSIKMKMKADEDFKIKMLISKPFGLYLIFSEVAI